MDVAEIGCQIFNWIHLAQDSNRYQTLVNTITNVKTP